MTFNYLQSDVVGNEANYRIIKVSGGSSVAFPHNPPNVIIDTVNNTATIKNVTSFSDWTLGGIAPTAAPGSIRGQVRLADGTPLAGVTITLRAGATDQRRQTVTDAGGSYAFAAVETGDLYTITAMRRGYTFTPPTHGFTLVSDQSGTDFIARRGKGRFTRRMR